jgi:predicted ester cyclase
MVFYEATKKAKNSVSEIVLNCVQALKDAHKNELWESKGEKKTRKGTIIQIKFKNKVQYDFPMLPEEYFEYKSLFCEPAFMGFGVLFDGTESALPTRTDLF